MKKKIIFLLLSTALFNSAQLMAQWNLAGNAGTNPPVDFLGTTDNKGLIFKTNNIERMRIAIGGKVGIRTVNPQTGLHVNSGAGQNPFRVDINGAIKLMVHSNGGLSVGSNTAPFSNNSLFVSGNIEAAGGEVNMGSVETLADAGNFEISSNSDFIPTNGCSLDLGNANNEWRDLYLCGNVITVSDLRLKRNIRDLNYGLKEIMQLRAVKYNLKDGSGKSDEMGMIAQEIQKVLPEVVVDHQLKTDETGTIQKTPAPHLSVKYMELIPVLIHAMQEQQTLINDLEKRLNRIEKIPAGTDGSVKGPSLEQNEPNPFNQATTIRYKLPAGAKGQIMIYDASGNLIRTMQALSNGQVQVNAYDLKAGNYTYNK